MSYHFSLQNTYSKNLLRQVCQVEIDFNFAHCYQRITANLIWNNNKKIKFDKIMQMNLKYLM